MIESAMSLGEICTHEFADSLIFVGTAGSYDPKMNLLEICVSFKATQIEASYAKGMSYTPIGNHIETEVRNVPRGTSEFTVNSSNYVHTDEGFASQMLHAGITLENMEFFSVMKAAESFGIECMGIFCVTNHCNANAHADFLANLEAAKAKLEEFVRKNPDLRKAGKK